MAKFSKTGKKSKYPEVMGSTGLVQISLLHALILLSGFAGLNSRRWIENGHVGPFGELGRTRRIARRFA